jgi:hypothetical protein
MNNENSGQQPPRFTAVVGVEGLLMGHFFFVFLLPCLDASALHDSW